MDLPGVPPELLQSLAAAAGADPIALVGGAVRDLLLHRVHQDPWRGLPDLDLVVEGPPQAEEPAAVRLARALEATGEGRLLAWREHGAYGTVELELELQPERPSGQEGVPGGGERSGLDAAAAAVASAQRAEGACGRFCLDVATARRERYPLAGANPQVRFGTLLDDLARRDFSINAMALRLWLDADPSRPPALLDPHGGLEDLRQRQLRFLHGASLRDDPTRLIRAARYAARLGFRLDPASRAQVDRTLDAWPWPWRPGDPPERAPAALGTRLRMELDLLLEREPWPQALAALQGWGGLRLLEESLQRDQSWRRRLRWASRLGLPRLLALIAGAEDPVALARRLQLPHRQQRLLADLPELRRRIAAAAAGDSPLCWTTRLEARGLPAEVVALALTAGLGPRRPLLRWWLRWRHLKATISASELLAAGVSPGPALGEGLRRSRAERLQAERP